MVRIQQGILIFLFELIVLFLFLFSCKKDFPIQSRNNESSTNQEKSVKLLTDSTTASGINYYVDPSSTASSQIGSISAPWKTLAQVNSNMWRFKPGDHIYFKKGQYFKGALIINRSGTASAPIIFTTYGSGNAPIFEYDLNTITPLNKRTIIDITNAQYIVMDGLKLTDRGIDPADHRIRARVATGIKMTNSSFIQISHMDISLLGIGISITANNNMITDCTIKNMRMIVNDAISDNDFGAIGIVISGSNNTISKNILRDLWATSIDYGYDGGAIEFLGPYSNNKVLYNTCINNSGFTEFGSNIGGTAFNNLIAYNLLINNGTLLWFNLGGTNFSLTVNNLQFYNNTVAETAKLRLGNSYLIGASSPVSYYMLNMKNNLFYINTPVVIVRDLTTSALVHTNNLYRMTSSGTLGFNLSNTERSVAYTTTLFQNTTSADPSVWNYNLVSGCPAVDRGTNLGFSSDLNGNSVYKGNAPDAGALESSSTAPYDMENSSYVGRIQAENYIAMSGVQIGTTYDAGADNYVGWIDDGDWMDYQVTMPSAGTYKINFRVASAINGAGPLQVRNASGTVLASVNIPNTGGWDTYTTVSTPVTLPAGKQTLRVYASLGGWNFNWFEIH